MLSCSLKQVKYGEYDAMLSLKLMFKLSALPLTRQLTNISGNLWGKTLQVLFTCMLFDLFFFFSEGRTISNSNIRNYDTKLVFFLPKIWYC